MYKPLIFFVFLLFVARAAASDLNLPDLGGASGGLISTAQEYELGQAWQRAYRAQTLTTTDPFVQVYAEQLIRRMAKYSDIQDNRLDILVVENPTLNAFAVPGGVIGINAGLFLFAETEQQFSSVVAHELAHISQRHFARRLGEQKDNAVPNLIALLGSILVAAAGGGEAGLAAISATQAAAIDQQLSFSRKLEREADRVGMETMIRAGMNPYAMPDMFEVMLRRIRFSSRPPEFLITHPLTESRVSDAKLRAQQYSRKQEPTSLEYQLVRIRVRIKHSSNLISEAGLFEDELNANTLSPLVARYGLALALIENGKLDDAEKQFKLLLKEKPQNIFFRVGMAELLAKREQFKLAAAELEELHKNNQDNHVLNVKLAEIYMEASEYNKSRAILQEHIKRRKKDDYVWYLLAEVHGLTGDIYNVHLARTEYFLLNGIFEKAENHVRSALRMLSKNDHRRSRLESKLKDIQEMRRDSKFG